MHHLIFQDLIFLSLYRGVAPKPGIGLFYLFIFCSPKKRTKKGRP
jgi:hypothetical protein